MIRWVLGIALGLVLGVASYLLLTPNVPLAILIALNTCVIAVWLPLKKSERERIPTTSALYPFIVGWLMNFMIESATASSSLAADSMIAVMLTSWASITVYRKFVKMA